MGGGPVQFGWITLDVQGQRYGCQAVCSEAGAFIIADTGKMPALYARSKVNSVYINEVLSFGSYGISYVYVMLCIL